MRLQNKVALITGGGSGIGDIFIDGTNSGGRDGGDSGGGGYGALVGKGSPNGGFPGGAGAGGVGCFAGFGAGGEVTLAVPIP